MHLYIKNYISNITIWVKSWMEKKLFMMFLVCHDDHVLQPDLRNMASLFYIMIFFFCFIFLRMFKFFLYSFPIFSVVSNVWNPLYIECICGRSSEHLLLTYIALLCTYENNFEKITERPPVICWEKHLLVIFL